MRAEVEAYRQSWKDEIDKKRQAQNELERVVRQVSALYYRPGQVAKSDLAAILGLESQEEPEDNA